MWIKILLLLVIWIPGYLSAQIQIQGIIVDSVTREPLPFVHVAVKGTTRGTTSQLNGKFQLTVVQLPVTLVFSSLGYRTYETTVTHDSDLKIYLSVSDIRLEDVVVTPGEDPAYALMKKVVQNSDKNNPENGNGFTYSSYHKMIFTLDADSLKLIEEKNKTTDKELKKTFDFFEKQHLFMSECITEKKFKNKNHQKETIISSRVSGFSTPVFSLISTQLQSFHFYKSEISLGDVKYVGPVSKFGLSVYKYTLQDTFYLENDTVFVLSFLPMNERNGQTMKGILQIHTDGYAIYNIIAEPFIQNENSFGMKISQQYQKIKNEKWFPSEFTTHLILNSVKIEEFPITGIGYGKIYDVQLNPEFKKGDFDEFEVELSSQFSSVETLMQKRPDSLSNKEKETYRVIDSLGKKHQLDKKMQVMQSLIYGYVPIKFLDWDISKLFNYNDYEGMRLGVGLRTNHKLSKWFSLGGYAAYGFSDKAFKYGSDATIKFSQKRESEINFSVTQDIEPGSVIQTFEKSRMLYSSGYSSLFYNRFDSVLKYETKISLRTLRHFKITLFGNVQSRQAYRDYSFVIGENDLLTVMQPAYHLTETGVEIKFAWNEKFIQTPFGSISTGTDKPLFYFRYTQGHNGFFDGNYNYSRITFKSLYTLKSLKAGNFFVQIQAGTVRGETPYHLLFNPSGTYRQIRNVTVFSMDGFETMRTNEFLSSTYGSLHFRYQFPKPLVNGKKFRPMISVAYAGAVGNMKNSQEHQNIYFQKLDHLYNESGLVIDNLLKSGISGLGLGFFYRWGYYQLRLPAENFALKISISLALG